MLVVKLGGAAGIESDHLCEDVASQWRDGEHIVCVHGGSDETSRLAEKLGHPPRFVTSVSGHTSRLTDRQTLEIFLMATSLINRKLVEAFQSRGINAIGLSGLDGRLISARRKEAIRILDQGRQRVIRDDWTGTPETVNTSLLSMLLNSGYLPVIAPVAISSAGEALNVDADRLAALVAGALNAQTLVLLTNVPGVLRSFPDESTLIRRLSKSELDASDQFAAGRMRKKLLGASEALFSGVETVVIGDARRPHPLSAALAGEGTVIQ